MAQSVPSGVVAEEQVIDWLRSWFAGKAGASSPAPDAEANYLELGVIDSLGLLELISGLEQRFQVRFAEAHFQDPRFSTIRGLSRLVAELRS